MAIIDGRIGNRNHPAAKQRASPTTGNHENSNAGTPHLCTRSTARFLRFPDIRAFEEPLRANIPSSTVVNAPKVLPTVAVANRKWAGMEDRATSQAKTASEPPGAIVEEMKALTKSAHSCGLSSIIGFI